MKPIRLNLTRKKDRKSPFSIHFKHRRIFLTRHDLPLTPFCTLKEIEVEVLGVSFPFDLASGVEKLKNKRLALSNLTLSIDQGKFQEKLLETTDQTLFPVLKCFLESENIILQGIYRHQEQTIPFLFEIGYILNQGTLSWILLNPFVAGELPFWHHQLLEKLLSPMGLKQHSPYEYRFPLFPELFFTPLIQEGFKLPRFETTALQKITPIGNTLLIEILPEAALTEDLMITQDALDRITYYQNILPELNTLFNDRTPATLFTRENYLKDPFIAGLYIQKLGDRFIAGEVLKQVMNRFPQGDLLLNIATTYRRFGMDQFYQDVMQLLIQQGKKEQRYDRLELYYLGLAYYFVAQHSPKSLDCFSALWQLNPHLTYYWEDYFYELITAEKYLPALEIGEALLEQTPLDQRGTILESLGDICQEGLKQFNKALEFYTAALELNKNSIALRLKVVDIYINRTEHKLALLKLNDLLEQATENHFKYQIYLRFYQIWHSKRNFNRALFYLDQLLQYSVSPELYWEGARDAYRLGDLQRERHYLKELQGHYYRYQLQEDDLYLKGQKRLGFIYFEQGDLPQSRSILENIDLKQFTPIELERLIDLQWISENFQIVVAHYRHLVAISNNQEDQIEYLEKALKVVQNKLYQPKLETELMGELAVLKPKEQAVVQQFLQQAEPPDYERTIAIYRKQIDQEMASLIKGDLYFRIYNIYLEHNQKLKALEALQEAITVTKRNPRISRQYESYLKKLKI